MLLFPPANTMHYIKNEKLKKDRYLCIYGDDCTGAFIKITKDVTRGNGQPDIFQFQVKAGQTQPSLSSKITKTEDSALSSLKEKVRLRAEVLTHKHIVNDILLQNFTKDW